MVYYNLLPWVGTGKDAYAYIERTQFKEELVKKVINGQEIDHEEIRFDLIGLKNVSKRFPDLMGTGSSEWFISDKFRDIIESMETPERIRFIRGMFTRKPEHYNFVNILNNVDCFDQENSEYTTYESNPKVIRRIQRLAIQEEKVNGRNIFRIAGYPVQVFISEKLLNAMQENEITGYALNRQTYDIVTT